MKYQLEIICNRILLFLGINWLLIVTSAYLFGQIENTWEKKSDFLGGDREKAVAFSLGDFGYIATGVDTAEITRDDLWRYEPETDTWTQMANLPGPPRRNAISFTINSFAYVGTGLSDDDPEIGTYLNDLWRYDPVLNEWDSMAPYPGGLGTGMYYGTAFSIGNSGFICGGKIGSNNYLAELWEYNSVTDSWTERPPFPGGDRYQLCSFSLEGMGYVGLGTDNDIFRKDFWQYNPETFLWLSRTDFPGTERAQSSTFTIKSTGFVIFGLDGGYKDELWSFNPYSNSWTINAPFPGGGRKNAVALAINNIGYAGIGKEPDGKKESFYAYQPKQNVGLAREKLNNFTFYPNPTHDFIHFSALNNKIVKQIIIQSLEGKILKQQFMHSNQQIISLTDLNKGIYMIYFIGEQDEVLNTEKIIKL
jgi:N-acetylneuraminic acid mutarotase